MALHYLPTKVLAYKRSRKKEEAMGPRAGVKEMRGVFIPLLLFFLISR
jgi:hypothetical protein